MHSQTIFRASTIGLLLLLTALPSAAEDLPLIPKWEFDIGSWFISTSTDVRVDASRGSLGTRFNMEDALELDDSETVFRLSAARRIRQRHQLRLSYSEYSRDGRKEIPFEIRFGDVVFPVDAVVDTTWDFTYADLSYSYFFNLKDKTAWSVLVGLGSWDFDIGLTAREGTVERTLESDVDVDELVPEVGLAVRHLLTPKFLFKGSVTGLVADLDDEEVTVLNATLRFDYRVFKKVGIAIAGTFTELDYTDSRGEFIGDYNYAVNGIQVFIPIYLD